LKLVICWPDISGYMAACWRALSAREGIELKIIAFHAPAQTFDSNLVAGLDCRLLDEQERHDSALVESLVDERQPEVLYTSGWSHGPYRRLMTRADSAAASKWVGVDTPWRGTLRQQIGRLALRSFIARADRLFVPGERAWQYMRRLGAPESRIVRGLYGIDYEALAPLHGQREQQPGGWPRRFLYVGRYSPEKGIDTLVDAYALYRRSVFDPWPLTCCGKGEMESLLNGREGIENLGFRQPGDLPRVMREHGVFVLPSRFDPWPLVVAEASAAGLPVICTERCGSAVELVRPYHNGITTPGDDAIVLADAMRWMHHHFDQLPAMGKEQHALPRCHRVAHDRGGDDGLAGTRRRDDQDAARAARDRSTESIDHVGLVLPQLRRPGAR